SGRLRGAVGDCMAWLSGLVGLLLGVTACALYARLALTRVRLEAESWRSRHESQQLERAKFEASLASVGGRVPALEGRIESLLTELTQVRSMNVEVQTRLQEQARAHQEKIAALTDVRGGIDEDLKSMTAEALRTNQGAFLELANQVFEKHKVGADAELAARQAAVAELVSPLQDMLQSYRGQIEQRERCLALHAVQLRAHMKKLAAKAYWDGLTVTPDFVVMFVPGDNFYAAALERDPALFEDAAAQRVIIATPSTLIALAKAIAFGWRQEKVAENAQRVHELGRELYRRTLAMTEHIQNCGAALGKSVKCFNEFIGSLEHSVMPQARRFNELEVEGTATEIPLLGHIELEPRLLRADRDFAEQLAVSASSNTDSEKRPASAA